MHIRHLAVTTAVVVLLSSQVFGQARVVEAGGAGANSPGQSGANNDLVVSLYDQLTALQQEVQTLRGLVEEQGNQLRRLQTEQRDRYLDIDQRLSELTMAAPLAGGPPGAAVAAPTGAPALPAVGNQAAPTANNAPAQSVGSAAMTAGALNNPASPPAADSNPSLPPAATTTTSSSTVIGAASSSPPDEQELYRNALKLLVEENKYDESIRMFQTYIDVFPQGRLLTNSLYWQGEAYLLVAGFPQAQAVFNRLLTEFPQDPKAPDAMLKMGKAYEGMGDIISARTIWQELPARYPESANNIRLAREYLQKL